MNPLQQTTFENIDAKGGIVHNERCFSFFFPQSFQPYSINNCSFIYSLRVSIFFLLNFVEVVCCRFGVCGTRLNLSLIRQFCSRRLWTYFVKKEKENLYNWMDNLLVKVENIVEKEVIARVEQFLLLSLCFQKAVCCRGGRKGLYEGKGGGG